MGCLKLDYSETESPLYVSANNFGSCEKEVLEWNSFELRMYDPVIGRWTSIDPYRQYWSPYMAMGNNWPNRVDPDGGCVDENGNPCPKSLGLDGVEGMFVDLDAFAPGALPDGTNFSFPINQPGVPINTSLSVDFQTAQDQAAAEAAIVFSATWELFKSQFVAENHSDDPNVIANSPPIPGSNALKASPRIFKATETVRRSQVKRLAANMKKFGWVGKPIQTYALKDGTQVILNGHHRVQAAAKAGIDVHFKPISLEEAKAIYNYASELEIITAIIR